MHTHVGIITAATAFFSVILLGTLWRLISAHLAISDNETVAHIGKAMAFQY